MEIIYNEPAEQYHKLSKDYLTSSDLRLFMQCPKLYEAKRTGVVRDEQTAAMRFGAAFHCLVLEPTRFAESHYSTGPINKTTQKHYGYDTKAFADWRDANKAITTGREYISPDDEMLAMKMAESVKSYLDGMPDREVTIRGSIHGVNVQCRIDFCDVAEARLGDLKSCASLDGFESEISSYGYFIQVAYYSLLLQEATGKSVASALLAAVEKSPPYRSGGWRIDSNVAIEDSIRTSIRNIKDATVKCSFPGKYDGVRCFAVPEWASKKYGIFSEKV